jgi:GxxExxY protein
MGGSDMITIWKQERTEDVRITDQGGAMGKLVEDATGNQLTYQIIGAAMEVHNTLGPGLKEEAYEKALEVELNKRDIPVQRQFPVSVEYGGEQVALFYLDLFVGDRVVIEIRASATSLRTTNWPR